MRHIEQLVVQNYWVLKEITLDGLQPMSVVLGPNGCGKSTLFDVFGFLSDAMQTNDKARSSREAGCASFVRETARARSESRFGIENPCSESTSQVRSLPTMSRSGGRRNRPRVRGEPAMECFKESRYRHSRYKHCPNSSHGPALPGEHVAWRRSR